MKYSTILLPTLLLLFSSLSQADKIYTWVDENGKTHFSDTPTPGATSEEVENKNLFSSEMLETDKKKQPKKAEPEATIKYQAEITFPKDDSSVRSNEGTLEIHVSTAPIKESSHKLQLYLDGKKLGNAQYSPTIRALNVDRGTHQVQVQLLDEKGKLLAKTQIVTVHLQRAAVGN